MLKWFPSLFGYDIYAVPPGPNLPYSGSVVGRAILAAAAVILGSMAGFILTMRNNMMTTLDEDFVLVAAAKGLPVRSVVWYAARNALLPVVANFTIAISLLVAGQILVEIVFNYPGIGFHLFDALAKLDYSLVQGIFVVITLVVLAANLLAAVVYVLIDPRARQAACRDDDQLDLSDRGRARRRSRRRCVSPHAAPPAPPPAQGVGRACIRRGA